MKLLVYSFICAFLSYIAVVGVLPLDQDLLIIPIILIGFLSPSIYVLNKLYENNNKRDNK